jgi:hypothetical protein
MTDFRPKFCMHFSSYPRVLHSPQTHLPPFYHTLTTVWWRVQILKILSMQFSVLSSMIHYKVGVSSKDINTTGSTNAQSTCFATYQGIASFILSTVVLNIRKDTTNRPVSEDVLIRNSSDRLFPGRLVSSVTEFPYSSYSSNLTPPDF